jgi:zinc transport system permease protein
MLAVITLAVIIILVVSLWFHELMAMTFDPDFAKVNHYLPQLLQTTVSLLTSWLVIIGIRSTGSLLMSSFLLFPTLIVMNFKQGFKPSFFLGIGLAASNFVIGFLLSLWLDWPTGSTIVVSYSVIWLVTVITTSILQRSKR